MFLTLTIVILGSIVVSIPACHAGDRCSTPIVILSSVVEVSPPVTLETGVQFQVGQQEIIFSAIVNYFFKAKTYSLVILGGIVVSIPICHTGNRIRFSAGTQEIIFSAIINYPFQAKTYCPFSKL